MNPEDRAERSTSERNRRAGRALEMLGSRMSGGFNAGWEIMGLSVRKPRIEGEDFLITVRALTPDGQPVVAFSGGAFLDDAFVTLVNRIANGTLKWREDQFGR